MSGAITATGQSDSGWMSSLISDAANVRAQEQTLTNQVSTGQVSSTYAGLGSGAAVSLDINPEIANLTTWQSNINQAAGTMDVTQTAMTQLQSIASSFYAQVNSLNTGSATASSINTIAASAQSALQQVAGLLDTTDGNTYVFGGADTANPPVPNPDAILTSGFATQISGEVANLATSGATATASAIIATGSSNTTGTSPFSLYMSQSATTLQAQAPVVQVGQGQIVQIGLLASANSSAVTSTGVSTGTSTGSYMRDLMSALATIGSLSASQVGQAGFQGLMQSTGTTLQGVVTAMGSDAGVLGNTQTALTASQSQMADTVTALTTQVGAVQNVDMAQTMSNLTLVQTQLQASYQMIAGMSALSLVKFLPS
jgi:flagellin-like hook-associated protein FlgL